MREITLEELLEAGCHFGHQVTRQNPKARHYIFEARDNIHIIDLAKTKEELEKAAVFVKSVASRGGSLIMVGTKRQARPIVVEALRNASEQGAIDGLYSVTNRWIGGILTNFSEVSKNYKKLQDLRAKLVNSEEKAKYTKREVGLWEKERQKLESFYGGIETMAKTPDALFIIDTHLEELAVKEAVRMEIPTVGIVDTNADPHVIDYPIPANDDAVGSIKLITSYIMDAWIEGKTQKQKVESKKTATTEGTEPKNENTEKKQSKTVVAKKSKEETADSKKTEKKSVKTAVARKTKSVSK